VRTARRVRSVEMEVDEGRVRGIAVACVSTLCFGRREQSERMNVLESPDTVLMKICIVSSLSEAVELRLEVLGERRMMGCDVGVSVQVTWCGRVVQMQMQLLNACVRSKEA
jgi:hypothetical protein